MLGRIIVGSTVLAAVLLTVVLQTTSPSSIGPVGLLAVFFLLYIVVLGCVTELLFTGSKMLSWLASKLMTRRPLQNLTVKRAYYFSSVLALVPIMMLAMQSIGSLGPYELLLVVIFMTIGIVYVAKRS